VEVAKYYGFDGWLMNIEVDLKGREMAEDMCLFLEQLTKKMHAEIPHSLVLWFVQ